MRAELLPIIERSPVVDPMRTNRAQTPASPRSSISFAGLCRDLLRDERRLREAMRKLSHRQLEPAGLLELQVLAYAGMQRVEVVSRCVQTVQSTLNHLRQGQ